MKKISKSVFALALLLFTIGIVSAQAPSGYYDAAIGKNKAALLKALEGIVGPHTAVSYDKLWTVYKTSDVTSDGYIWDMYATTKFKPGTNQCGSYTSVGSCYNREHSFPKSWFNDATPMYSDAYHIYPTDGKVNGQRSNYPYGECADGKYLAANGTNKPLGKLGTSTFAGYSGVVFEPDDEYKGDFARTYFYMAAAYNSRISNWSSAQLAGNDYPCFNSWSINLLMKWSREDPVSQKEINRNNIVNGYQKNRNPFIDYPELAEYIWGTRVNDEWTPGGSVDPVIVTPIDGSSIDMGIAGVDRTLTYSIRVKGTGLTKDLSVSVTGDNKISVNKTSITAADACAGAYLLVSFKSADAGVSNATITISSSEATTSVAVKAEATDGIPALAATNITKDAFTANWTDVDMEGNYQLSVFESDGTTLLTGYPVSVTTADESYDVTGLDYSTDYYYQLSTGSRVSNKVKVTTADPDRILTFDLPEGGLAFTALPGEESNVLEAKVYTEYIDDEITVDITGEFEISLDKTVWSKSIIVNPEGESVYVRMKKTDVEKDYFGTLSLHTAAFVGADVDVSGTVSAPRTFLEDFEAMDNNSSYSTGSVQGTACLWDFKGVAVVGTSSDHAIDNLDVRLGKTGTSSITMAENKPNGVSTLSFYAGTYGSDADSDLDVSYSLDGGDTWTKVATITLASGLLEEYSYTLNIQGNIRFKFAQAGGKRVNIDNISISDYVSSVSSSTVATWDAYSTGSGKMVVETAGADEVEVYSLDAIKVYDTVSVGGKTVIDLPSGIYVVVCGNNSKKVIVK